MHFFSVGENICVVCYLSSHKQFSRKFLFLESLLMDFDRSTWNGFSKVTFFRFDFVVIDSSAE